MTIAVLVAACVAAIVDWWAVGTNRRDVEAVAKPLTMALLIVVAMIAGDVPGDVRVWLVIGAFFGLVGDVALLRDNDTTYFLIGLSAFAIGHLAYAVSAATLEFDPVWLWPGIAFVIVLLGYRFLTRILPGAVEYGGRAFGGAVLFYALVISAMVITAWTTTIIVAAVGAMLFAISDWVLGHRRFVGPLPGGRLAIMIPYHVGQALLILGITSG